MDKCMAVDLLKQTFPEAVTCVEEFRGETTLTIDKGKLRDVMKFLKESAEARYDLLVDLTGVDLGGESPRFLVVYLLHSTTFINRLRIKTAVEEGSAIDTVSDIWKAADWFEREVYDMLGIPFTNHPDLRRILMTDDFVGHPLRKDFPLKGHAFDKPVCVRLDEEEG
jgi:NADH-quinone oxidoreductase subunit C